MSDSEITVDKNLTNALLKKVRKKTERKKERKERKKEMFYLTTHSTHFIYGYMASDMW